MRSRSRTGSAIAAFEQVNTRSKPNSMSGYPLTNGCVDSAKKAAGDAKGKAEELKDNIDFDKQHVYSERFTSFLQSVDRTLGEKLTKAPAAAPTEKTKELAENSPATSTSVG
ncbi:hypothetical protein CF327_g5883 [Tilletia walkeri]|nr:hypothetical protein CF327_g5883 [Tilletia walkeri]